MHYELVQGVTNTVKQLIRTSTTLMLAIIAAPRASAQTLPSGVINAPPTVIGSSESIGSDTTLNVFDGGLVGPFFNAGLLNETNVNVEVNISGGNVGPNFAAHRGSTINISGGSVGIGFYAFSDSTVNISGGAVGNIFEASSGSTVNISAGSVGDELELNPGAELVITGGTVGDHLRGIGATVSIQGGTIGDNALFGSYSVVGQPVVPADLEVLGGTIGDNFTAFTVTRIKGGTFGDGFLGGRHLFGDDFRLDGVPIAGLDNLGDSTVVSIPAGRAQLTGTLQDGTPFIYSQRDGDFGDPEDSSSVTLTRVGLPSVESVRRVSESVSPILGIRNGEELIVDGPLGDHINAGRGSVVKLVSTGSIGENFEAIGATINLEGGAIGPRFEAYEGTTVNVRSGDYANEFLLLDGSTFNVSGGTSTISSRGPGTINVSGGKVTIIGTGIAYSTTHFFSGGNVILPTSTSLGDVHFVGREFAVDGQPLNGLNVGSPLSLSLSVGQTLSGSLADGTVFEHEQRDAGRGRLAPFDGLITVTLVPEPSTALLVSSLFGLAVLTRWRATR